MPDKTLGVIGAGNMGSAIVQGVLKAQLCQPHDIVVSDLERQKAENLAEKLGVEIAARAPEAARAASIILLAVKPQNMNECLSEIESVVGTQQLVLSIAAGITTRFIEDRLRKGARVVRVMPNTPALVGAGATAICPGAHATHQDLQEAERIFSAVGKVYRLDESLMDAVTAVSGSGPAYLFLFAECLENAAVGCGLPEREAADLVAQTLFGASKLLIESGEQPSSLRARVTSPGGTTEAAVATLNRGGFGELITEAVQNALNRAQELGGDKKR
ncbi:MAG: pyrroline-5-carboxylate reductase [Candidatus Abyssubacteria bacterium]